MVPKIIKGMWVARLNKIRTSQYVKEMAKWEYSSGKKIKRKLLDLSPNV